MRDLEKQGKAGTAEYKNLNNELKKNGRKGVRPRVLS